MSKTFSIAETAEAFGLPPSTLRYYDKEGLLPGVERTEGGMRRFTPETLRALHIIACLKTSGLSIQEIREFFALTREGTSTIPERLRIFESRREAVKRQIRELEETLEVLDLKCWYYETAARLGSEAAVDAMEADEVPPDLRAVRQRIGQLPGGPHTPQEAV